MSSLSAEFKKKLEELATNNDEKMEDVILLFQALKSKVLELEPHLSNVHANIRTYNGLLSYYSNKKYNKGSEFVIIPMGVNQEPKDTNKKLRDEIIKDFSNPQKRLLMIAGVSGDGSDGKVMVIKTSDAIVDGKTVHFTDVYKPVKTIKKMTQMNNGEWIVVQGEQWQPGDIPIARDYRKTIQYVEDGETYDNTRGWSRALNPNWKFVIFGLGFFPGNKEIKTKEGIKKTEKNLIEDSLISRVTFYGALANPTSPKFIGKRRLWFGP